MKDIAQRALNAAQLRGASYADVRVVRVECQTIEVKNGRVDALAHNTSEGLGVRVLLNGCWGFASTSKVNLREAAKVAAQAVTIARASSVVRSSRAVMAPSTAIVARYDTPRRIDPFQVALEDKVATLLAADKSMRRPRGIAVTEGSMECSRELKTFASTEGSYIEQELVESGAGIEVSAVGNGEIQTRSYPNSFGRQQVKGGYEHILQLELDQHGEQIAEEALALLTAPQCPSLRTTLILDSTQLALQVHESCGHPAELDRVLGDEASFAGTSFLTTDKLGSFRYGSPQVTIVADATVPSALGTFGFDDEGVPAQRSVIVDHGLFKGYLMSRESAATLGRESNGTMRADGWNRIPLIRMTNINLEPGEWRLDDLIADTDDGIYMAVNKSWSIDDKRLNFQFGTQLAYEIKHGKLGRLLKNANYSGITPEFWASCDAVCGAPDWQIWGLPNCGKGQPMQTAHVGHGAAPARFRNVQVGIR